MNPRLRYFPLLLRLKWALLKLKWISFLERTHSLKPLTVECPPFEKRCIQISTAGCVPTWIDWSTARGIEKDWPSLWPQIRAGLSTAMADYGSRHSLEKLMGDDRTKLILSLHEKEVWSLDLLLARGSGAFDYHVEFQGRELVQTGAGF